jgi:hypothetical protein
MKQKGAHCWVTNVTKTRIIIGDLGLPIAPWQTLDLLDPRYSILTAEQVAKSEESGSLCKRKKQKVIVVRRSEPVKVQERQIEVSKASYPYKLRSLVEIENPIFEELEFEMDDAANEAFANKNADYVNEERGGITGDISKFSKEE